MAKFDVRINFRRLQADMQVEILQLPDLFKKHFNVKVGRSAAYAWFERGKMPLHRLVQLLTIVSLEGDKPIRLNLWDYIEAEERTPKKRAA